MAPSAKGRDLKRYYKQSKKKSSGSTTKSKGKKRGKKDLTDDDDGGVTKEEQMLKQFDMNMVYGPCLGLTRLARWERAQSLGLNPPKEVEKLLREINDVVLTRCMWNGRVI